MNNFKKRLLEEEELNIPEIEDDKKLNQWGYDTILIFIIIVATLLAWLLVWRFTKTDAKTLTIEESRVKILNIANGKKNVIKNELGLMKLRYDKLNLDLEKIETCIEDNSEKNILNINNCN